MELLVKKNMRLPSARRYFNIELAWGITESPFQMTPSQSKINASVWSISSPACVSFFRRGPLWVRRRLRSAAVFCQAARGTFAAFPGDIPIRTRLLNIRSGCHITFWISDHLIFNFAAPSLLLALLAAGVVVVVIIVVVSYTYTRNARQ